MIRTLRLPLLLACTLFAATTIAKVPPPAAPLVPAPPASAPPTPVDPVPAVPALTASDVSAWLDGYFPAALKQAKVAGAQVVVVKDGKVIAKKGYGFADVAAKTAMDPDRHLMRIGSTSKLFTWLAVMQQVEAGRIDLNADINRYLDFRITPKGRAITMNDLMNHRGGFEEGLKDILDDDPKRLKTTEQYLKANRRPQLFEAGAVPAYSNYGAALAGYIVQRVSGEPFEAYVQRHILQPLEMRHTTFVQPLPAEFAGAMSKGYRLSTEPPAKFELVATAPAGSGSTTGADMANFMIANLQDGRFGTAQLLRPETYRQMLTPTVPPRPGFDAIAHGFFRGTLNGRLFTGHGGDTIVFHTDLTLLPEQQTGIFVTFNSRGENDGVYGVRSRLLEQFMDRYFPAPVEKDRPAIATAASDAAALAGRYESSRRIETGFISLFYLLQQDQVIANPDGTISLPSIEDKKFREVAPGLWREVGGARQLAVTDIGGRRSIIDSANPVSVMQAVPLARNAMLNLSVAGLSVLVLLLTALLWPVAAWLARKDRTRPAVAPRAALTRRLTRVAAVGDLLYLGGWYAILSPILQTNLEIYNDGLDGLVRGMQVAAIIPIAGAAIGLWNVVTQFRSDTDWGMRMRAVLVALALLGTLWIAYMGGLMTLSLAY